MYSTHNKGKSVAAKIFIRTLENKIYGDMISVSKNLHFDKLDEIVNKYNKKYSTIKTKTADVKTFLLKDILQIGQKKFLWS